MSSTTYKVIAKYSNHLPSRHDFNDFSAAKDFAVTLTNTVKIEIFRKTVIIKQVQ